MCTLINSLCSTTFHGGEGIAIGFPTTLNDKGNFDVSSECALRRDLRSSVETSISPLLTLGSNGTYIFRRVLWIALPTVAMLVQDTSHKPSLKVHANLYSYLSCLTTDSIILKILCNH